MIHRSALLFANVSCLLLTGAVVNACVVGNCAGPGRDFGPNWSTDTAKHSVHGDDILADEQSIKEQSRQDSSSSVPRTLERKSKSPRPAGDGFAASPAPSFENHFAVVDSGQKPEPSQDSGRTPSAGSQASAARSATPDVRFQNESSNAENVPCCVFVDDTNRLMVQHGFEFQRQSPEKVLSKRQSDATAARVAVTAEAVQAAEAFWEGEDFHSSNSYQKSGEKAAKNECHRRIQAAMLSLDERALRAAIASLTAV